MREITLTEAMGHRGPVFVEDARCVNKVEARCLSIKYRPRLQRYDVTYKVALWWRSFKTSNPDMKGFWVAE